MSDKERFTIIRESGRCEFFDTAGYLDILDKVSVEYNSAGGNWDRPNMLLLNGKVVIDSGLSELAWRFGERRRELREETWDKIKTEFKAPWEMLDAD